MENLVRKTFNVEISFPKRILWKTVIRREIIHIQQPTIMEVEKYFKRINKNKSEYLYVLIAYFEDFRGEQFTKNQIRYLLKTMEIVEIRQKTFLYGLQNEEQIPTKGKGTPGMPISALYLSVSKETNTPIMEILNTWTYEQLWSVYNGMVWNSNSITDEGKKLNAGRARNKEFWSKNDREKVKEMLKE